MLQLDGEFVLVHDGWPCILTLRSEGHRASGSIRDCRWPRKSAALAREHGGAFVIVARNFNMLDAQKFSGWTLGAGSTHGAGVTHWHGRPFGFFLSRLGSLAWTDYASGKRFLDASAFEGRYWLRVGDRHGQLILRSRAPRRFHGEVRLHGREPLELLATSCGQPGMEHEIRIRICGLPVRLRGYLFTHTQNAIAGAAETGGKRGGFVMWKCDPGLQMFSASGFKTTSPGAD